MARRKKKTPAYLLHKPSGRARVRIGRDDFYLGAYGSPENRAEYDEVIANWLAGQDPKRCRLTVADLVLAFIAWGEEYYRRPDGTKSGELENLRAALEPLTKLYGRRD